MTACLIELSYLPDQVRSDRSRSTPLSCCNKVTALEEAAHGPEPGGNLVSSTPIEVPWVDYIPPVVMPVKARVYGRVHRVSMPRVVIVGRVIAREGSSREATGLAGVLGRQFRFRRVCRRGGGCAGPSPR